MKAARRWLGQCGVVEVAEGRWSWLSAGGFPATGTANDVAHEWVALA
ncbi:hypothetical protein BDK92_5956 [Micromonospora pisi]|uniref:Uncharacterized protein n=2 Tax=Micromonospora pisi TaxID=589240 RepID=A0A495JRE8_9ACTN|nr:hypothetical protein BDK92_5956 [Micromonospora pisi]